MFCIGDLLTLPLSSNLPADVIEDVFSKLLRTFLEQLAGIAVDPDYAVKVDLSDISNAIPSYALQLQVTSIPFLSRRTTNGLLRYEPRIQHVSDLIGKTDEVLLRRPHFGVGSLKNLKSGLLSLPNENPLNDILSSAERLTNQPDDSSIDANENDGLPIAAHPQETSLLVMIAKVAGKLSDRNMEIVRARLGTDATLDELGVRYEITRERVRQIVKNFVRRCDQSGLPRIAEEHFKALLVDRRQPLFVDLAECEDSWFVGISMQSRFLGEILHSSESFALECWRVNGRYLVTRISADQWLNVVQDLQEAIEMAISAGLRKSDVALLCDSKLTELGAVDLLGVTIEAVEGPFVYDSDADPRLISAKIRTVAILEGLIASSSGTISLPETMKKLVDLGVQPGSEGALRNLFVRVGLQPVGDGRYATFEMLWPAAGQELSDTAQFLEAVCMKEPGRQFHTSELFERLKVQRPALILQFSHYRELDVLLSKLSSLQQLGRSTWTFTDSGAPPARIDIQQAAIRIVERAGGPLDQDVIFREIRRHRGIGPFPILLASKYFIRVSKKVWGLYPRDLFLDEHSYDAIKREVRFILSTNREMNGQELARLVRARVAGLSTALTDFMLLNLLLAHEVIRSTGDNRFVLFAPSG